MLQTPKNLVKIRDLGSSHIENQSRHVCDGLTYPGIMFVIGTVNDEESEPHYSD